MYSIFLEVSFNEKQISKYNIKGHRPPIILYKIYMKKLSATDHQNDDSYVIYIYKRTNTINNTVTTIKLIIISLQTNIAQHGYIWSFLKFLILIKLESCLCVGERRTHRSANNVSFCLPILENNPQVWATEWWRDRNHYNKIVYLWSVNFNKITIFN